MKLNRREILKSAGLLSAGAMSWGVLPSFGGSLAYGAPTNRTKLVVCFWDGGPDSADWLPYDLPEAIARRGAVQRASAGLINIGHQYVKLSGNLATLYSNFGANMAMFSCVAEPNSSGSHDVGRSNDARAANANSGLNTGMMGRILEQISAVNPSSFLGFNFVANDAEQMKASTYKPISAPTNLANYSFANYDYPAPLNDANETRHRAYLMKSALAAGAPTPLSNEELEMQRAMQGVYDSVAVVRNANAQFGTRTVTYPNTPMANSLRSVATLISAGMGDCFYLRNDNGHDTHSNQIANNNTSQTNFANAMNAFLTDMNNIGELDKVVVLCLGEFGRQIGVNATAGTDHGWGKHVFAFGGRVNGGLHGPVATPAQIATDFALPRAMHPNIIKKDIVQIMGLDPAVIIPTAFTDVDIPWIA